MKDKKNIEHIILDNYRSLKPQIKESFLGVLNIIIEEVSKSLIKNQKLKQMNENSPK